MTTRAEELMERGMEGIGIGVHQRGPIAMPCLVPGDEPGNGDSPTEKTRGQSLGAAQGTAEGQSPVFGTVPISRGERVVGLVCRQVSEMQKLLDASFAVSVTVSYNAEKLAEEFGVPAGRLLSAFARATMTGLIPQGSAIFSDHRVVITLGATVVEMGTVPPEQNRGQSLEVAQGPAKGQSPFCGTVPISRE